jgi:putative NADH-flavin reductase
MRVLVIGAAGRTGRLVVEQALGHGHDVTAFVRDTDLDAAHPRLTHLRGDVLDFDAVSGAVAGHSALALAVGRGGRSAAGLHEAAAGNVIHAMALHGASRLAVLSAAGAFARTDPNLSFGFRAQIATTLRSLYDDLERMERRVMASDLDWTIVRPVGLSDTPATGHYRISRDGSIPAKVSRISRADVAAVMLKALETDLYRRRAVVVAQ